MDPKIKLLILYFCPSFLLSSNRTSYCTPPLEGTRRLNALLEYYPRGIPSNNNLDENSKCDDVLAFYLFKVARNSKEECFEKVLQFVILFRECLNYMYKDTIVNKTNDSIIHKDFSEEFTCEDAPDISNEFILEFLQTDQMIMGYSKEEAIDLTQNLCQWLYDNNFTCSKLSLINNS